VVPGGRLSVCAVDAISVICSSCLYAGVPGRPGRQIEGQQQHWSK